MDQAPLFLWLCPSEVKLGNEADRSQSKKGSPIGSGIAYLSFLLQYALGDSKPPLSVYFWIDCLTYTDPTQQGPWTMKSLPGREKSAKAIEQSRSGRNGLDADEGEGESFHLKVKGREEDK